jgi:hypothetical protein
MRFGLNISLHSKLKRCYWHWPNSHRYCIHHSEYITEFKYTQVGHQNIFSQRSNRILPIHNFYHEKMKNSSVHIADVKCPNTICSVNVQSKKKLPDKDSIWKRNKSNFILIHLLFVGIVSKSYYEIHVAIHTALF